MSGVIECKSVRRELWQRGLRGLFEKDQQIEVDRHRGVVRREPDLRRMAVSAILIHMKTTLNIDDDLLAEAHRLTRIEEKTALVHAGLVALIARESARRLVALGGSQPTLASIPRRRSTPRRSA